MNKNKKEKLALFDLDGTLFNTDDVNYLSYRDALLPFDIKLDREFFVKKCNGRSYKDFLPGIMGGKEHIEEVHDKKMDLYVKYLGEAKINSHLFDIIRSLKETYYIAIVTTASKKNTEDILNHFKVGELFDYCITKEDIKITKPDPEGFLSAMKHFNISASDTVIFEDSDVGIEAARASGASVFAVEKF